MSLFLAFSTLYYLGNLDGFHGSVASARNGTGAIAAARSAIHSTTAAATAAAACTAQEAAAFRLPEETESSVRGHGEGQGTRTRAATQDGDR